MYPRPAFRCLSVLWLIMLCWFSSQAADQSESSSPSGSNYILMERPFQLPVQSEVAIRLVAKAFGTSWGVEGSEAAIIMVLVDGTYSQDVVLFYGAEPFAYRALLGQFSKGRHQVSLVLNRELGSKNGGPVSISRFEIIPLHPKNRLARTALGHAPMLYARPNTIGRFSDTPLLSWYEASTAGRTLSIRYSFVFSNEDAGTETEALMARWGRTTDIEWAYEIKLKGGRIVEETFQGLNHKTLPFKGQKLGGHPLLMVASDNNNFADDGQSKMIFALWPERMDLARHSREEIMDKHGWSYRVMSEELAREGKISEDGGHKIPDPRKYIYVEAFAPHEKMGTELVLRFRDGHSAGSSLGRERLLIDRSGWFRAAAPLPPGESWKDLIAASLHCRAATQCMEVKVNRLFRLDDRYNPRKLAIKPGANPDPL